jgi:hypothetical protein
MTVRRSTPAEPYASRRHLAQLTVSNFHKNPYFQMNIRHQSKKNRARMDENRGQDKKLEFSGPVAGD